MSQRPYSQHQHAHHRPQRSPALNSYRAQPGLTSSTPASALASSASAQQPRDAGLHADPHTGLGSFDDTELPKGNSSGEREHTTRGTSFQPLGVGIAMAYPSQRWYYATPSSESSSNASSPKSAFSISPLHSPVTIPDIGEDEPDGAPVPGTGTRPERMSAIRQHQYSSVSRKVFSRLPESADHALLFVGDSPEMEWLASYLSLILDDGRTSTQMKHVVRAREVIEMGLYYAGYQQVPTPIVDKCNPQNTNVTPRFVDARLEHPAESTSSSSSQTTSRIYDLTTKTGIHKAEFIHHAYTNIGVFGSYLNCRVPHYSPPSGPHSGFVVLSSPGPHALLEVLGAESRAPLNNIIHASTIAEIASLLTYLETTPPETIAGIFRWPSENRPNGGPNSTRVSMLTSLTRFLLGLYSREPVPASMKKDGRYMWARVRQLRKNHELQVLRGTKYKEIKWIGDVNTWAVRRWEEKQRSWFEKAVNMGWVANKEDVNKKADKEVVDKKADKEEVNKMFKSVEEQLQRLTESINGVLR
ncbi:hypothetical protein EV426DRAFT_699627 [Tirmania nivea]|nr:hypothetical protein EV426DRAFT_699627 [Tirmania nivea]